VKGTSNRRSINDDKHTFLKEIGKIRDGRGFCLNSPEKEMGVWLVKSEARVSAFIF
jgi:hypothetical protein